MSRAISLSAMAAIILALFTLAAPAMPLFLENMVSRATSSLDKLHARAADTCADPSLAKIIYSAFTGPSSAHILGFRWLIADEDSKIANIYWVLQGGVCNAWPTQQPSTVPLFLLQRPDGSDYMLLTGPDASTPPSASGYTVSKIIAWVYDGPVCGSIPLYALANAAYTDHYYTVDTNDWDSLTQLGWTGVGVVAYVLPL